MILDGKKVSLKVLEDVKKHYYSIERGVIKAVDGVSLTINKEEIFGNLLRRGRNNCYIK